MTRLIVFSILFLFSLLNLFRAPLNILWYVSILTTEFCWIFFIVILILLIFYNNGKYALAVNVLGGMSLILFALPIVWASIMSHDIKKQMDRLYGSQNFHNTGPFNIIRMISGIGTTEINPQTYTYSIKDSLTMHHYPATGKGKRPCIIVIHGGSWAGGEKEQLPELNSYLAKKGYHVFCINYRLVPEHIYPSPIEDTEKAIRFLQLNADRLNIDAGKIVLLGRSAGAQIALNAAYGLNESSIKGVISYYGPTDMIWGYHHRANPLVLDSRKIMEDYLGGTFDEVPDQYRRSSAVELVTSQSVPTLLIQGKNDPLVAYDHCNRLAKKLNEWNVDHFVLRLPWATHGCDYTINGPSGQLSTYVTSRFLEKIFSARP